MKDFNEFISSLTEEDKNWILGANEESKQIEFTLNDPNFGNKISAFLLNKSFSMNVRFMELYHQWISEQLQ